MVKMVIDQNLLNAGPSGIRARLNADPELRIVVPDVSFVEMCKGSSWEEGMRLGLAQLEGFEDRIEMSAAVGELLSHERDTKLAVGVATLFPGDVQAVLKQFVQASTLGTPEQARAAFRAIVGPTQKEVESDLLDAAAERARTLELAQMWRQGLGPHVMKAVASSKTNAEAVSALVQVEAASFAMRIATQDLGLSEADAIQFVSSQPMILRYSMAVGMHTLRAARYGEGGLPAAEKELNNRLDVMFQ